MKEWYSIGGFNDPMSSLSHLIGTVIFFVFSVLLLRAARHSRSTFWYSFQFVLATLFLLSMSFVYHMMGLDGVARDVMLRLDTAAIFVLIASTFTVIHGILFADWRRWAMILAVWAISIPGIVLRTIFYHSIPKILGDLIFLAIGWIGGYSAFLISRQYGWRAIGPIVAGGVLYSIGAWINASKQVILIDRVWGPHETFHLFVLVALGVHWSFVWSLADGSFQRRYGSAKFGPLS